MKRNRMKKIILMKEILLIFVLTAIAVIVLHGISVAGKTTGFSMRQEPVKYYTSVTIRPGDTLWSIAEEYMPKECTDTREYIHEIMELNHLPSFDIHSGGALVVPYYDHDGIRIIPAGSSHAGFHS